MRRKAKAIGLFSGGLDSILAIKILEEQSVKTVGLTFKTPFFQPATAIRAAKSIKLPLIVKDVTRPYMRVIKHPRYGYGRALNPCIDCHAYMAREALKIMKKQKLDFVFTGEVLNERPMSQTRPALGIIAKLSGCTDRLLRPLSAKLLPVTYPERLGLVDRDKLLAISGRSRSRQIVLARKYKIKEYPTPAGGCLLTEIQFANKLADLLRYDSSPPTRELELLKLGRHFRISPGIKLIIGRNKEDNRNLRKLAHPKDILISCEHIPGPVALLTGKSLRGYLKNAACAALAYSDAHSGQASTVYVKAGRKHFKLGLKADREYRLVEKRL